jgi:hypothetical protein
MKSTVPVSDIVPLVPWIQQYHDFRRQLNLVLQQTGKNPFDLHRDRLGIEVSPGVWEGPGYKVLISSWSVSFEVAEDASIPEALEAFDRYQQALFGTDIGFASNRQSALKVARLPQNSTSSVGESCGRCTSPHAEHRPHRRLPRHPQDVPR